jgi:thiosulfate/3-mercaptopyruvate sulfurtransferase
MTVLLSADDLRALLDEGAGVRLLDVRWRLDRPDGRGDYRAGHVPGAVYVDLETELAGRGDPTDGRHPLPRRSDLEDAARSWGVDEGDAVVVYDDLGGMSAARAWWLLRHHGIAGVRILDGGLGAWRAGGHPLEQGDHPVPRGSVVLREGTSRVVDIDRVAAVAEGGVLVDARSAARYAGDIEPVDPRAGHIPGAVNAPTTEILDAEGRFRSEAELRDHFAVLGITPESDVAVYCGSGVTAAHTIAALAVVGVDASLFPGSWSAWSNHSDRPAARGVQP